MSTSIFCSCWLYQEMSLFMVLLCFFSAVSSSTRLVLRRALLRGCYRVQRLIPQTRGFFEAGTIAMEMARNIASVLPLPSPFVAILFKTTNLVFNLWMESVDSIGGGELASAKRIEEGLYLLQGRNNFVLGHQVYESIVVQTPTHAFMYGALALDENARAEVVGERQLVVILSYMNHHLWLSNLIGHYPDTIITGSRAAFEKHVCYMGANMIFTPLHELTLPPDVFVQRIEGVADEEYALLHTKLKVLFVSHFVSNPTIFAGISLHLDLAVPIQRLALWSTKFVIGWDKMPTDNPVVDRELNTRSWRKMRAHGDWTRVHSSHAGLVDNGVAYTGAIGRFICNECVREGGKEISPTTKSMPTDSI